MSKLKEKMQTWLKNVSDLVGQRQNTHARKGYISYSSCFIKEAVRMTLWYYTVLEVQYVNKCFLKHFRITGFQNLVFFNLAVSLILSSAI